MRRTIIAGNWKMNGTIGETESLIRGLLAGKSDNPKATVMVAPPYTALFPASKLLEGSHIALGAQDMSEHEVGAYTAEISAQMLLTVGVSYVILGHSERRQYHAETDSLVNAKTKRALDAGLTPVVCIGETLEQREAGKTEAVVGAQVDGTLKGFTPDQLAKIVIAYEPVWAIGTGKTATPEMAEAVHVFVRRKLAALDSKAAETMPILYGGSMKAANASGLLGQPNIDGGLVGGASLKADEFIGIINAV
ncbi:MAG: triose-phosphate isomerase [candidate division Zixibacteria bacterium]|nr:triose-phosphate isomerase [candidate division Zixibacteria bacterium]